MFAFSFVRSFVIFDFEVSQATHMKDVIRRSALTEQDSEQLRAIIYHYNFTLSSSASPSSESSSIWIILLLFIFVRGGL